MPHAISLTILASILLNEGPGAPRVPSAASASPSAPADFIRIERLSPRVVLAYWLGVDRRCNLTAIETAKGLVLIDTEMSPRIMAPIKQRLEQRFVRNSLPNFRDPPPGHWAYGMQERNIRNLWRILSDAPQSEPARDQVTHP
jgi:hypothetical protein